MTTQTQTAPSVGRGRKVNRPIALIVLSVCLAVMLDPSAFDVVVNSISEAYLAVATFVAATLLVFFSLERLFKFDLTEVLAGAGRLQVPLAAALGALPGCGGAIIVVTRYVSGKLSFGSVLATLTATMGDAAFLLIAKEPTTGLFIIILGFSVGMATGLFVDWLHGPDFMRPKLKDVPLFDETSETPDENSDLSSKLLDKFWMILILPGIVMGFALAFQIEIDELISFAGIESPATLWGFVGGLLCLTMWALPRLIPVLPMNSVSHSGVIRRTISDTNFVTSWVIFAFLLFELTVHFFQFDLSSVFSSVAFLTPLIAVLIGFLPGCGPQILVTTMYLSGLIPLSAQIGNAISNDGDALFPAIAMAPRAAIVATIYSALPALLLAYGWYFFVENG
ncbi:MAG: putative manganese transporter [Candidatus Puniceispirillaceae bacterium]